jgi:hypothetical protein
MNKDFNLTGVWVGVFQFAHNSGMLDEVINIQLTIDRCKEGYFEGSYIETDEWGAFNKAAAKGLFQGDTISFETTYTGYYSIDEHGNVSEAENCRAPKLNYLGQYDYETDSFFGKWQISDSEFLLIPKPGLVISGTWVLYRENNSK